MAPRAWFDRSIPYFFFPAPSGIIHRLAMADDLITALVVRRGTLEWTTLHRRKGRLDVVAQETAAFELPAGVTDMNAPEVVERLKPICSRLKGRLAVALPSEQVLMRVVRLPTLDAEEIREMAALQVDKFSPFPVEQMAVSQEMMAQAEGATRVLIAAVLQEHVAKLGGLLQAAGASPREVDVEVLGWWRLLKQAQKIPEEGPHILLIVDGPATELIVARDGVPVLVRPLGSQVHLAPAEAASEIAEELNYTLTTLESEWGIQPAGGLRLWNRDELSPDFLARLRETIDMEVETHRLSELSPLSEGLCRRAAERAGHMLDLAPPDWKVNIQSRKLKRILLAAGGAFLVLWLVAAGLLVAGVQVEKRRLAAARAELEGLQQPARRVEQMKEQVRSLDRYTDRTFSALECLREVSQVLPAAVDITAFSYKKYGEVNIRGEADSGDPIYDFFQALEKSELFPAVKPEGVTQQQRQGKMRSQFKVTIELPGEQQP